MSSEFNPEPRPQLEARITALLLGELSADEAEETRRAVAADAELTALYGRLEETIDLVRAASAGRAEPETAHAAPLQLADAKRQALLQRFKPAVVPFAPAPRRGMPWQAQLAMAAALVAFIGLVAMMPEMWSGAAAKTKGTHVSPVARRMELARAKDSPPLNQPQGAQGANASGGDLEVANADVAALLGPKERKRVATASSAQDGLAYGGFGGGGIGENRIPQGLAKGIAGAPVLGDRPTIGLYFQRAPTPAQMEALSAGVADRPEAVVERLAKPLAAEPAIGAQGGSPPTQVAGRNLARYGLVPAQPAPFLKQKTDLAAAVEHDKKAEARQLAEARGDTVRRGFEMKLNREQSVKVTEEKETDLSLGTIVPAAPVPQPEFQTSENAFSTFSLNVTDVSFKLAAASLGKGLLPPASGIRSEEFINAFDYHDPRPADSDAVSFVWERARYPFVQDRDVLRLAVSTAAKPGNSGRPLNLVVLLDRSGSMERADRVRVMREALEVLARQLRSQDTLSVVTFARTARLFADGVTGTNAAPVLEQAAAIPPEGGTNLEDALGLAYSTALRRHMAGGVSRVLLFTDGAANLGSVNTETLRGTVQANRQQGVALDCFGVGWEGFNDDLLQVLSSSGDGRYGFLNTPEEARSSFAGQLAGALQVAAADVKVQVEFNPRRVTAFRQVGYAKHQLTAEQFRDNRVDAAELGDAESGNALYLVQVNSQGDGPLAQVRVRYKEPGTNEYHEQQWPVPYTGEAGALESATPALRLATTAAAFSEWLLTNPFAAEVTPDRLLSVLSGVPEAFASDPRPKQLESMIRQAKSLR